MRPRTLDEFVGQEHLVGPGKPLRIQIERDDPTSMIFWGPPGTGKTTLAKIIARITKADFIEFSAVLAGMGWALENPNAGIVEADEMDFRRCLEVQMPYLGPVIGAYTDWTPLKDRGGLFRETLDKDPWQFSNVLVS